MTLMEPRVAERRKTVSEDRARKRLKWVLAVLAIIALVLAALWLLRSPVLSIRHVNVVGAAHSDPASAVSDLDMGVGTATIDVDGSAIAAVILRDAWVMDVDVDVIWPGSVEIVVTERTPVAPVLAGDGWVLVGRDAGVIMALPDPPSELALVVIDQGSVAPGDIIVDPSVVGALEFIDSLSVTHLSGTRLRTVGGGLIAEVSGHIVRLGRPVDMANKAVVLEALLESGVVDGAAIDLIAPLRPAVTNPQPVVEAEE